MDITSKPVCKSELSHISLCFGYGGIDLGLDRIFGDSLRLAAVCEIESFSLENAIAKMESGLIPAAPIWTDLRTFPWEEFQGVSLVSGGFPCQPFSAAGRRAADADGRHLFPAILDGIKRCRPSLVFLENVEGIISAKLTGEGWNDPAGTPVLLHVLRELERVGYRAEAGIFSASQVGAPHQRKRIFILAHRDEPGWETGWNNAISRSRGRRTHGSAAYCGDQGGEKLADSQEHRLQLALHAEDQSGAERGQGVSATGSHCQGGELADPRSLNHGDLGGGRSHLLDGASASEDCEIGDFGILGAGEVGASAWIWPSRPGHPQFWWEPPRVVDPKNGRHPADNTPSRTEGRGAAEPCLADGETMGDTESQQDNGGESRDMAGAAREGRCADDAIDATSQGGLENPAGAGGRGESGNTLHQGWETCPSGGESLSEDSKRGIGAPIANNQPTSGDGAEEMGHSESFDGTGQTGGQRETQTRGASPTPNQRAAFASLGRELDGTPIGLVGSELPRLSDEELAEIHQWMVLSDSRNDELRMLGNGVVPQTCEFAFRTLFRELLTQNNNLLT